MNSGLSDCSEKYSQQSVSPRRASVSWTPRGLLGCVTVSPRAGNFTEERSKWSGDGGQRATFLLCTGNTVKRCHWFVVFYGSHWATKSGINMNLGWRPAEQLSCFSSRTSSWADCPTGSLRKSCGTGAANRRTGTRDKYPLTKRRVISNKIC